MFSEKNVLNYLNYYFEFERHRNGQGSATLQFFLRWPGHCCKLEAQEGQGPKCLRSHLLPFLVHVSSRSASETELGLEPGHWWAVGILIDAWE